MSRDPKQPTLHCSFCGKAQTEVKKLVAGPSVYICDECIELCEDIIDEESRQSDPNAEPGRTRAARMMRLAERILDKPDKERFGARLLALAEDMEKPTE